MAGTARACRAGVEAGLFPYFPAQAVLDGLALFEYAARRFPVVVVAALD